MKSFVLPSVLKIIVFKSRKNFMLRNSALRTVTDCNSRGKLGWLSGKREAIESNCVQSQMRLAGS